MVKGSRVFLRSNLGLGFVSLLVSGGLSAKPAAVRSFA